MNLKSEIASFETLAYVEKVELVSSLCAQLKKDTPGDVYTFLYETLKKSESNISPEILEEVYIAIINAIYAVSSEASKSAVQDLEFGALLLKDLQKKERAEYQQESFEREALLVNI